MIETVSFNPFASSSLGDRAFRGFRFYATVFLVALSQRTGERRGMAARNTDETASPTKNGAAVIAAFAIGLAAIAIACLDGTGIGYDSEREAPPHRPAREKRARKPHCEAMVPPPLPRRLLGRRRNRRTRSPIHDINHRGANLAKTLMGTTSAITFSSAPNASLPEGDGEHRRHRLTGNSDLRLPPANFPRKPRLRTEAPRVRLARSARVRTSLTPPCRTRTPSRAPRSTS